MIWLSYLKLHKIQFLSLRMFVISIPRQHLSKQKGVCKDWNKFKKWQREIRLRITMCSAAQYYYNCPAERLFCLALSRSLSNTGCLSLFPLKLAVSLPLSHSYLSLPHISLFSMQFWSLILCDLLTLQLSLVLPDSQKYDIHFCMVFVEKLFRFSVGGGGYVNNPICVFCSWGSFLAESTYSLLVWMQIHLEH